MEALRDLNEIISKFRFDGKFISCNEHGYGNINDTFIGNFKLENDEEKRYIIQKINTDIFKKPDELMSNIENITNHIANKVKNNGGNPLRETLNVIYSKDGKSFCVCDKGECWRSFVFIEGASTYESVEEPIHMYKTGEALGRFQKYLADFPVEKLYDIIPNFHNTQRRYQDFIESVNRNIANRASLVQEEIEFIMSREKDTNIIVELINQGQLPIRVTHNDTKFNNIMIDDKSGEAIALIDLDTVMPGASLYDFGDAVRSGATTASEDEVDLSKVNFDLQLFKQFTSGYLKEMDTELTILERQLLPFSVKLITLELAMRFLGDYLNGDIYFKTNKESHNLDRTRNQIKLIKDIESRIDEMNEYVAMCK